MIGMQLKYFEYLSKFANELLNIVLGEYPEEALKIMKLIEGMKYDPWSYHDAFLELFAYRTANFLPGASKGKILNTLKTWIKVLEALKRNESTVRGIMYEVSHNLEYLKATVKHSTSGLQGELAAAYCLIDDDCEILPLTFIQCTNKGYAPGDILVLECPESDIQCMHFLEVTTDRGKLEEKIRKERKEICGKSRKYFGLVKVDVDKGEITLEIYDVKGNLVKTLHSKM
ncbi:MAG: hypothetical protein DRN04_12295 [Thermoprotei archaeon]|nr:MAG: hypothetical protein DRN04_12295 [Thermoprotei archaeon]